MNISSPIAEAAHVSLSRTTYIAFTQEGHFTSHIVIDRARLCIFIIK